jgi:hypothetical protein
VEKLNFWDEIFVVVPAYIIVQGFYIFIVGFFGIAVSGLENRWVERNSDQGDQMIRKKLPNIL